MGLQSPKLSFTISSCSGEEPDFPVVGLLSKESQVKGWQTPRFCKWPQQVTLQLEGLAKVQQIQILSHEYKIASKVELHIGTPGAGDTVSWKRLGSFSFDSNERSKLQARELKSVTVNVQALFVRIVLARCHTNSQNVYGQAGILGVSIAGDLLRRSEAQVPRPPAQPAEPPMSPAPVSAQSRSGDGSSVPALDPTAEAVSGGAASSGGDAAADGKVPAGGGGNAAVDAKTAARLAELESAKARAVADEDYDEAKRLKLAMDRLKALAAKLANLEAKKKAAVEAEDYDTAKALKQDIERLRLAGEAQPSARGGGPPAAGQPNGHMSGPNGQRSNGHAQGDAGHVNGAGVAREQPGGLALSPSSYSSHDETPASPLMGRRSAQEESYAAAASSRRASSTPSQAYDERPAVARGSYAADTAAAASPPAAAAPAPRPLPKPDRAAASASVADPAGPPPPGWPGDLAPPEALSMSDAKEASELAGILEEYLIRCLFSKNWQLREAALQYLEKRLTGQELSSDARRELARSLAHTLRLALVDKVPGVYMAGLSLLRAVTCPGVVAPRDCASLVADLAPLLIDKTGENNTRVQSAAVETLLQLAQQKEAGLSSMASLFLRPEKATQWKRVLGRLQLLEALIPVFGVGKGDGFALEPLMAFVGATLGNANAEVRSAATRVTVLVHGMVGSPVKKHLPAGLNPKILEQLEADFSSQAAASPAAAAAAATAPRTPLSGGTGGGGGRSTAAAAQPRRAASPPVPAVARRLSKGAPSPTPAARNSKAAAAAAAPVTVLASAHASSHYSLAETYPIDSPNYTDDAASEEAVHEAELQHREALLGPSHPDLADALSNLAILYNQRGKYERAQPLYERALRIYEAVYGPHSTEVAHTLTDLAVLHLEQGHDEAGRPLLCRALVIQEAALGPDHPDVHAIRDVLEGDD